AASGPVPVRPRQGPPAVAAECKHHARMTIVDRELYDPVQKTHHSRSHYVSQLNLRPPHPAATPSFVPKEDGSRETAQRLLTIQVVDLHVRRATLHRFDLSCHKVPHRGCPLHGERIDSNLHIFHVMDHPPDEQCL